MNKTELLSLIALAQKKNQKSQTKLINSYWVDVFSFVMKKVQDDIANKLTRPPNMSVQTAVDKESSVDTVPPDPSTPETPNRHRGEADIRHFV